MGLLTTFRFTPFRPIFDLLKLLNACAAEVGLDFDIANSRIGGHCFADPYFQGSHSCRCAAPQRDEN